MGIGNSTQIGNGINIAAADNANITLNNIISETKIELQANIVNFYESKEIQYSQYITNIYNELDKIDVPSKEIYEKKLDNWLSGWRKLDENSQKYLVSGEFIYESLNKAEGIDDYSPFILQFSRILERQVDLLFNNFAIYYDAKNEDSANLIVTMKREIKNPEYNGIIKQLENFIKNKDNRDKPNSEKISFGSQILILLLFVKTRSLNYELIKIFEASCVEYIDLTNFWVEDYIEKLRRIKKDYRNEAAHPGILNRKDADLFRNIMTNEILPVWVDGLK